MFCLIFAALGFQLQNNLNWINYKLIVTANMHKLVFHLSWILKGANFPLSLFSTGSKRLVGSSAHLIFEFVVTSSSWLVLKTHLTQKWPLTSLIQMILSWDLLLFKVIPNEDSDPLHFKRFRFKIIRFKA